MIITHREATVARSWGWVLPLTLGFPVCLWPGKEQAAESGFWGPPRELARLLVTSDVTLEDMMERESWEDRCCISGCCQAPECRVALWGEATPVRVPGCASPAPDAVSKTEVSACGHLKRLLRQHRGLGRECPWSTKGLWGDDKWLSKGEVLPVLRWVAQISAEMWPHIQIAVEHLLTHHRSPRPGHTADVRQKSCSVSSLSLPFLSSGGSQVRMSLSRQEWEACPLPTCKAWGVQDESFYLEWCA